MEKRNYHSHSWILCALTAFAFGASAHAAEEEIKNYRGIRSAGMGGLITTTGNYGEALFGNPARHSEIDTWKVTLLDPTFEVNTNLIGSTSSLSGISGASGADTISSAAKLIGKNEHLRLQLLPGFYNPKFIGDLGFAFGLLVSAQTNLLVHYTTDIETQTFVDIGPNFGFSLPFLEDRLTIGLNLHILYRVAIDDNISALSFLTGGKLSFQNFGRQGLGLDADLGGYYHIPWEPSFMRVSVGASLNNLAKSHYTNNGSLVLLKGAGDGPTNNARLFNTGFRLDFPDVWILTAPLFAFELQDIGETTKRVSNMKRTHMGAEVKLTRVLSVRTGLSQGYLSAGLGIDLPLVKLDFATYGEELGGNAGVREDRRLMFRLALEL